MLRHRVTWALSSLIFLGQPAFSMAQDAQPAAAADAPAADAASPSPGVPGGRQVAPAVAKGLTLWEDFIHYLRVAQLELATAAGKALLGAGLQPDELLTIVEEVSTYNDYEVTLSRSQKLEGEAGQVAKQVSQLIEDARLALAREGTRVRQNIDQLDEGLRARLNAQARLKRAGEYAAPQMLAVLTSMKEEDQALRPYVIEAMVNIGRPIVAPLAEALGELPSVPKQQVAEVLARIGYPLALPYLKAELEKENLDAGARKVLEVAYQQIVGRTGIQPNTRAADLFLLLAEDYYSRRESLVLQPGDQFNLMWTYAPQRGLISDRIPTPIFGDVMAMRASRRALALNNELTAALSLWLTANFRRENSLPEGAVDPSYGPEMRSPHFYATLAGPRHVQPVLLRALEERNSDLALDAIRALATTAGTPGLLNLDSEKQPLLAAMVYPDRRVRFEAAYTIARAEPRIPFSGAQRVVPVLAESLREAGKRVALVISDNTDLLNATAKLAEASGYVPIMGNSFDGVVDQVVRAPGIDLVIVNGSGPKVESAVANVRRHFKTGSSPVLVLTAGEQVATLSRVLSSATTGVTVGDAGDAEKAAALVASTGGQGAAVNEEQAKAYAMTSLRILHDLAIERSDVFPVADARGALIDALKDPRPEVALASAEVLSHISSEDAQRALAENALDEARGPEIQVPMLRALAAHARKSGNLLTEFQLGKLAELLTKAQGDVADAASEVHGSLNLPTSAAVNRITGK